MTFAETVVCGSGICPDCDIEEEYLYPVIKRTSLRKAKLRKFHVKIRFGSSSIPEKERPVEDLTFNSKEARDSYLQGVGDMDGWCDYEIL